MWPSCMIFYWVVSKRSYSKSGEDETKLGYPADTFHLICSLGKSYRLLGLCGWSISLWDDSLGRCLALLKKLFYIGLMIPGSEITLCREPFLFFIDPLSITQDMICEHDIAVTI